MEKVQEKKTKSVCYTPSSKPYSVDFNTMCSLWQCQYQCTNPKHSAHQWKPDGQKVATYKKQTENHKRVLSLLIEATVLQSKRANAKSFTTVRKLCPSHSYFRKTHTLLGRIICWSFTPNFIKIDQGLKTVKVQTPLAPPPAKAKYDCHCIDFHETRNRSTAFCKLLCRNTKQYRRWQ
jgi:hypothetical protein